MSASFRIVYYTRNPVVGARVPIGSLILQDGKVGVARVGRLPSAACLGSRSAAIGVRRLIESLEVASDFDSLPSHFGPFAELGKPQRVPRGVVSPKLWLEELLAPKQSQQTDTREVRSPRRSSVGYVFFKTWHVARYVKKTFKPVSDWDAHLQDYPELPEVSHWVGSSERLLLMEPIIPARRQFDQDVSKVARRFMAYRYALSDAEPSRLLAYLPPGGPPDRRIEARERLTNAAHTVIDTMIPEERDWLLEHISELGEHSRPTLPIYDY